MRNITKKFLSNILRFESELVLWKYRPKIVAITGSVGKTSTKDAVFAVLSKTEYVRKSEKSFNSEIGLPLTILGCPNGWNNPLTWTKNILKGFWLFVYPHKYPKWLVLEVGVGKPGDMKKTASWLKTDVVIFTAIGETPVHIEFFDSRDHLVREKSELIKTLKTEGLLVLNADDKTVLEQKTKTKSRVMTYGFSLDADLRASSPNIYYDKNDVPEGLVFRVDDDGSSLPVVIDGVFGKNHIYASLGALALARGLKLNMIDATNALKNYDVPPGRMRLLRGIKNTLIIDDTYNSSPTACEVALETLGEVKSKGRKIAVLGDMLELGRHTEEAHRNVGKKVKGNADILFTVGLRAKEIKEGTREMGMTEKGMLDGHPNIFEFLTSKDAGDKLRDFIEDGDLILIKGSQGMRMERAVETVLEDQANKSQLLVRQDPEWLAKP